jgi:hypothetical protein
MTVVKAVATPLAQGLFAGAWSASRGMPAGRRRLVRVGAVAAAAALAAPSAIREIRADQAKRDARSDEPATIDPRQLDPEEIKAEVRRTFLESTAKYRAAPVLGATAVVTSTVLFLFRRRLEKRWLHDLRRHGHPHPHRAAAVRVAALTVAANIPSALLDLREARAKR